MPPVFSLGTITNNWGHHVFRADIDRFSISGKPCEGNRAQRFVWRDSPHQQTSHLDQRNHQFSRVGILGGVYPLGYEVCHCQLVGCFVGWLVLPDYLQGVVQLSSRCWCQWYLQSDWMEWRPIRRTSLWWCNVGLHHLDLWRMEKPQCWPVDGPYCRPSDVDGLSQLGWSW